MTKELYEILQRIKQCLIYKLDIKLTYKELHLVMKYINELETEIAGGYEDID